MNTPLIRVANVNRTQNILLKELEKKFVTFEGKEIYFSIKIEPKLKCICLCEILFGRWPLKMNRNDLQKSQNRKDTFYGDASIEATECVISIVIKTDLFGGKRLSQENGNHTKFNLWKRIQKSAPIRKYFFD